MIDPEASATSRRWRTILDFWERVGARVPWRRRNAAGVGHATRVTPYDGEVLAALLGGVVPVDDEPRARAIKRFNATLVSYLFLLYFDTRVGDGRHRAVRTARRPRRAGA